MTTRKSIIVPVEVGEFVELPADWFSRSRKYSTELITVAQSAGLLSEDELSTTTNVQNLAAGENV
jgi:hypothetical protein